MAHPVRLGAARLVTFGVLLATPAIGWAQAKPDPLAGLDAYIEKVRTDWTIPGMAVAIVKGDSVVYAKGFGLRELGKADAVDARTLFAIGSNTKSFTATAAAMLVDEGKMRWNDPVTKWLPWFQLYDPYVTREINLSDVLSHRSGLGRQGDMIWYGSSYDRNEVIRRIRFLKPNAPFRTELGYQNIMFSTAGQMVGAASGIGYDQFITTRIFAPLEMTTSTTTTKDLPSRSDVATPHAIEKGTAKPIPHRNLDNVAPAGSIYSSVEEMTHYLKFQLNRGTYNGKKLVGKVALDETWTPHINAGGAGDSLSAHSAYGFGWVLTDYRGHRVAWHNGGIDGMLSEMWTLPDDRLGIVVLTNGSPHSAGPGVVHRIIDQFIGAPAKDWNAEALDAWRKGVTMQESREKDLEAKRAKDSKPSLPLARYAATYRDEMYGDFVVTEEGGKLVGRFGPFTADLSHWQYDTFTWASGGLSGRSFITFHLDAAGRVAKAETNNLGTFTAVPPK